MANATWAGLCVLAAVLAAATASAVGPAHLIGAGLFVGGLAALGEPAERLVAAT